MSYVYRRLDELRSQGVQILSYRIGNQDVGYFLDSAQRSDVLNVRVAATKINAITHSIEEALNTNMHGREVLKIVEEQLDIHFPADDDPMRNIIQRAVNARRELMREHSKETNRRNHEFISGYIDTIGKVAVGQEQREYLTDEELISLQISLTNLLGYFMSNRLGGSDMSNRIQTINSMLAAILHIREEHPHIQFTSVDEDVSQEHGISFQMYERFDITHAMTHVVLATNEGVILDTPVEVTPVSQTGSPAIFTESRTMQLKLRKAMRYLRSQHEEDKLFFIQAPGRLPER